MYDATMVAIDVEATGLSDIDDEVIEVAAVRFRGLIEVDHLVDYVKYFVFTYFRKTSAIEHWATPTNKRDQHVS